MLKISNVGKYLDQPLLSAKINKHIPTVLTVGAGALLVNQMDSTPPPKRPKTALKSIIILGATIFSAIKAPKIANYITGRKPPQTLQAITEFNTNNINEFLNNNKVSQQTTKILEKAKSKILSLKEIAQINTKENKTILDKIIPPPENIQAKDIFKEIGWLSTYGAIPVAGGITGGIIAEKLTEKDWKSRIPNKINEGIYQYLANIFLCNVGAGAALGLMEKLNIKSKTARCLGMTGGIVLTGIAGGSAMANFIGKKIINPMMSKENKSENRTPELLDIGLHADDIATVSLLSGLKWIEPSLPLLYSISGYRAGIGYRNAHNHAGHEEKAHFLRKEC